MGDIFRYPVYAERWDYVVCLQRDCKQCPSLLQQRQPLILYVACGCVYQAAQHNASNPLCSCTVNGPTSPPHICLQGAAVSKWIAVIPHTDTAVGLPGSMLAEDRPYPVTETCSYLYIPNPEDGQIWHRERQGEESSIWQGESCRIFFSAQRGVCHLCPRTGSVAGGQQLRMNLTTWWNTKWDLGFVANSWWQFRIFLSVPSLSLQTIVISYALLEASDVLLRTQCSFQSSKEGIRFVQ